MTGTLREHQYTFLIISLSFLLRMRNASDKICAENQNTHFYVQKRFSENRAVYEMWKNTVQPVRPQMSWRMSIACWIPNATDTLSEYVDCI